uniref:Uncharacterized protein n=1 Tax=Arundo donax TaxID=35708 RepID=A0A0A9BP75_ARUDO
MSSFVVVIRYLDVAG